MEDHNHEEHGHEDHVEVGTTQDTPVILEKPQGHEGHDHSGLEGLLEVMFGFEHVVAEFFWNTVWLGAAFAVGRLVAFSRVHKYIDDKHGVSHKKDQY